MKRSLLILAALALSACGTLFPEAGGDDGDSGFETPVLEGTPSPYSQTIYESSDLSDLCLDASCEPYFGKLPDNFREFYDPSDPDVCGFDDDPNLSTQFVLKKASRVNGLRLLFSKEDLFFLAWASLRQQINPHFLMGVMAQESYGNCAAVSSAGGEGCFQITNYWGRLQLEQSYPDRVAGWHWADPFDYYPSNLFIDELTWFGESPDTDQFRLTLNPGASTVLGIPVSSVINFPHGVIGSASYYYWQQYFLYYNYRSQRSTASAIIATENGKAGLMAAAYNGGIGSLANALGDGGANYLSEMRAETQDYVDRVIEYCQDFQNGASHYTASYNFDEISYIIDLLSQTYPGGSSVDWQELKDEIEAAFFSTQDELSFTDDVKALVYFISTFDTELAPEIPEDIND